jgi:hypothetical protein
MSSSAPVWYSLQSTDAPGVFKQYYESGQENQNSPGQDLNCPIGTGIFSHTLFDRDRKEHGH